MAQVKQGKEEDLKLESENGKHEGKKSYSYAINSIPLKLQKLLDDIKKLSRKSSIDVKRDLEPIIIEILSIEEDIGKDELEKITFEPAVEKLKQTLNEILTRKVNEIKYSQEILFSEEDVFDSISIIKKDREIFRELQNTEFSFLLSFSIELKKQISSAELRAIYNFYNSYFKKRDSIVNEVKKLIEEEINSRMDEIERKLNSLTVPDISLIYEEIDSLRKKIKELEEKLVKIVPTLNSEQLEKSIIGKINSIIEDKFNSYRELFEEKIENLKSQIPSYDGIMMEIEKKIREVEDRINSTFEKRENTQPQETSTVSTTSVKEESSEDVLSDDEEDTAKQIVYQEEKRTEKEDKKGSSPLMIFLKAFFLILSILFILFAVIFFT